MNIPYGFDCYTFAPNELKYFEPDILGAKSVGPIKNVSGALAHQGYLDSATGQSLAGYVRFTRKNEYYTPEQLGELTRAEKLTKADATNKGKQIFCGIKIQIGIGVVTNFLRKGLQYRPPIKGWSYFKNGTWTGIVSGLTVDSGAHNSYDMAFGNFLAYDEEFPYMNFGPFYAVESKLVLLTGSSRRIEASSFGTNMSSQIWVTVLSAMLVLSLLASFRVHWQYSKHLALDAAIEQLLARQEEQAARQRQVRLAPAASILRPQQQVDARTGRGHQAEPPRSLLYMVQNFFFIYFTMLLNKPCLEFDELIWPKHGQVANFHHRLKPPRATRAPGRKVGGSLPAPSKELARLLEANAELRAHYEFMIGEATNETGKRKPLPTSVRILSYLWSAACLVMASIYSGEMLAVILLHADTNIDTIQQLINSKPPIEPVIRQDDFTYNLMLKSLDRNMLTLHNMTKMIARPEVYTQRFIESVSERKQALLGDDELIETIYDIYHKYFPLHRSQVAYLQYPISIMYRKDLDSHLERLLRRGIVQIFEMGLIHRWYQAQKDTYIHFYDRFEKKDHQRGDLDKVAQQSEQKYKPLSMRNFYSFFRFMLLSILLAWLVLLLEIIHHKLMAKTPARKNSPLTTK